MQVNDQTAKTFNQALNKVYVENNLWKDACDLNHSEYSAATIKHVTERYNAMLEDIIDLPTYAAEYKNFEEWWNKVLNLSANLMKTKELYKHLMDYYNMTGANKNFCGYSLIKFLNRHGIELSECENALDSFIGVIKLSNGHILVYYDRHPYIDGNYAIIRNKFINEFKRLSINN